MGRLAERQSDLISQAGKTLDRSWRRVRGKRWKTLRARLGALSERAPAARRVRPPAARAAVTPAQAAVPAPVAAPGNPLAESALAPERASEPQLRSFKH